MITLNTIVYEGNFEQILSPDNWFFKFTSKYITNKTLTVSNVYNSDRFYRLVTELNKIYDFKLIHINKNELNDKFKLGIDNSTLGYNYTIPYFAAIDSIETKYMLNVASDCMYDINIDDDFLELAMNELDTNCFCSTVMVAWTKNNKKMLNGRHIGEYEQSETFKKLNRTVVFSDNVNYTANFTDQFFMGIVDNLKKIDYNISESISNQIYHGPSYGGNSFEKRMVGHQVQNNVYNCVSKGNHYYIHDNNYYN